MKLPCQFDVANIFYYYLGRSKYFLIDGTKLNSTKCVLNMIAKIFSIANLLIMILMGG